MDWPASIAYSTTILGLVATVITAVLNKRAEKGGSEEDRAAIEILEGRVNTLEVGHAVSNERHAAMIVSMDNMRNEMASLRKELHAWRIDFMARVPRGKGDQA